MEQVPCDGGRLWQGRRVGCSSVMSEREDLARRSRRPSIRQKIYGRLARAEPSLHDARTSFQVGSENSLVPSEKCLGDKR
jgi:hypothetical protein